MEPPRPNDAAAAPCAAQPERWAAVEQPAPVECPSQHASRRWSCKAVVFRKGTGNARSAVIAESQRFVGASCKVVLRVREEWIREWVGKAGSDISRVRGARRSATSSVQEVEEPARERGKRRAAQCNLADAKRAASGSWKPGPGRGHATTAFRDSSAPSVTTALGLPARGGGI
jgi:hypothetical protein